MKTNLTSLALAGLMLGACAGDKNEVQADGTILAVRTVESGEATEVALLPGNFETPEEAQAAVETAQWVPLDQFTEDEELDFVEASSNEDEGLLANASVEQEINFTPRGDRHRGDGFRGRGDRHRGDNFRGRGDRRRGHARRDRGHRGSRFGNHHRPGSKWRPHPYNQHWQSRPYKRPGRRYGNSNCGYIWYSRRCVRPRSRRYGNYHWRPRYGYTYRPHRGHVRYANSSWHVSLFF